jgi:glycosyltransferase involved in cell wall biosynthesis
MKILFASPFSLLDTTNGAALATRELLEKLFARGFSCEAVTASVFDPIQGFSLEEAIRRPGLEGAGTIDTIGALPVLHVTDKGIGHTILRTDRSGRSNLRKVEEDGLLSLVEEKIREDRPDVLLTYGGMAAEKRIHRLARSYGIPVVFYLHNSLYKNRDTFSAVDMVLVPSAFLQDFYARRLGLESRVLYPVFSLEDCRIGRKSPQYVTFINPDPAKGMVFFFVLARLAQQSIPETKFLVVEGRWGRADIEKAGIRLSEFPNVTVVSHQRDVRVVYAVTRVLLYPSFWVEAFGRIVVEAQMNGIAVLAARQGGIPEAANGGGFLLDVPERCRNDHRLVPSVEDVEPWLDRLRVLLENEQEMTLAETRAQAAAERFRSERIVDEAVALFQEAALTGPG